MKRYARVPYSFVCPSPDSLAVFTPRTHGTLRGPHLDTLHRALGPCLQSPQTVADMAASVQTRNLGLVKRYVEVMQHAGAVSVTANSVPDSTQPIGSLSGQWTTPPKATDTIARIQFSSYQSALSLLLQLTQTATPFPQILVLMDVEPSQLEPSQTQLYSDWFRGVLGTLPERSNLLRVYDLDLASGEITLRAELDIADPNEQLALPYRLGLVSPLRHVDQVPLAWIGPDSRLLSSTPPIVGLRRDESIVTLWLAHALSPCLPLPNTDAYPPIDDKLLLRNREQPGRVHIGLSSAALRATLVADLAFSLGSSAISTSRRNLLALNDTPASSDISWLVDVLSMKVSAIWASLEQHDSGLVIITTEFSVHRSLLFETACYEALLCACAALYYPDLDAGSAVAAPFDAAVSDATLSSALSGIEAWINARAPNASMQMEAVTIWGRRFWRGGVLSC